MADKFENLKQRRDAALARKLEQRSREQAMHDLLETLVKTLQDNLPAAKAVELGVKFEAATGKPVRKNAPK